MAATSTRLWPASAISPSECAPMPAMTWPTTMPALRHRAMTKARLRPVPTSCAWPVPMRPGYLSAAGVSAYVDAALDLDVRVDLGLGRLDVGRAERGQGRRVHLGEVVVGLLDGTVER